MDGKCALTLHASETKAALIHTSRRPIFVPGLRRVEDGISQPSGSIHDPFLVLARLLDDSALDRKQRASTDFKLRELIESYVCITALRPMFVQTGIAVACHPLWRLK
jgi:hypothetical protein